MATSRGNKTNKLAMSPDAAKSIGYLASSAKTLDSRKRERANNVGQRRALILAII